MHQDRRYHQVQYSPFLRVCHAVASYHAQTLLAQGERFTITYEPPAMFHRKVFIRRSSYWNG